MTGEQTSRRRFLKRGVAVSAASVAGCARLGSVGSGGPGNSVIANTSISGSMLVVELQDNHDISKVNLIDSSGTAFQSATVSRGANTVELELFDYRRGRQYNPGEFSVVAVSDGEEISSDSISIIPELEITQVVTYSGGKPTPSNRANLLVTVENTGTGPTWVYYVGYENALNRDANRIPSNDYAKTVPLMNLDQPQTKSEVILPPDESVELLGANPPFLLDSDDNCASQTVDFSVIVYSGIGKNPRKDLEATLSGDPLKANFRGTCSEISVEVIGGSDADE